MALGIFLSAYVLLLIFKIQRKFLFLLFLVAIFYGSIAALESAIFYSDTPKLIAYLTANKIARSFILFAVFILGVPSSFKLNVGEFLRKTVPLFHARISVPYFNEHQFSTLDGRDQRSRILKLAILSLSAMLLYYLLIKSVRYLGILGETRPFAAHIGRTGFYITGLLDLNLGGKVFFIYIQFIFYFLLKRMAFGYLIDATSHAMGFKFPLSFQNPLKAKSFGTFFTKIMFYYSMFIFKYFYTRLYFYLGRSKLLSSYRKPVALFTSIILGGTLFHLFEDHHLIFTLGLASFFKAQMVSNVLYFGLIATVVGVDNYYKLGARIANDYLRFFVYFNIFTWAFFLRIAFYENDYLARFRFLLGDV